MNDISQKSIVLKLNGNWERIGYGKVSDTIVDLVAGESIMALDINWQLKDDGMPDRTKDPEYINPVNWEDWIKLPIRPWDFIIHSQRLQIRVPTVVITKNYFKMPVKVWKGKPSKEAVYLRDGGICQYTGKFLDRKNATLDHVIPKSRGGSDDWDNVALSDKYLNHKKSNKLNHEIGLKLIRVPQRPKPIPVSALINEIRHADQEYFISR
jgi:5-methylcytosine-specific restriction endonuclease McrA